MRENILEIITSGYLSEWLILTDFFQPILRQRRISQYVCLANRFRGCFLIFVYIYKFDIKERERGRERELFKFNQITTYIHVYIYIVKLFQYFAMKKN